MKLMMIALNKLKAERKNYIIIYYYQTKVNMHDNKTPNNNFIQNVLFKSHLHNYSIMCVSSWNPIQQLMEAFIISCLTGFEFAEWG